MTYLLKTEYWKSRLPTKMAYNGYDEDWMWGSRVPPTMDTMKTTTSEMRMVNYFWNGGQRPIIWGTTLGFPVGSMMIDIRENVHHVACMDQRCGVPGVRRLCTDRTSARHGVGGSISSNAGSSLMKR